MLGIHRQLPGPVLRLLSVWLLTLWLPSPSLAQPFYFGNERPRTTTAVLLGYSAVDFEFDGDNAPAVLLDFDQPAYGASFSRSNLFASAAWARQSSPDTTLSDLTFFDLSLSFWVEMFFSPTARTANHRGFVPIMLFSNYRKVAPENRGFVNEFNITTIGLGAGLGYYGDLGKNVLVELRSIPAIGYASQSFGESNGLARMIDTDLQVHFGAVSGAVGISLGYRFLLQIWDVNATSIIGDIARDLYDYRGAKHTFSLGVNW